MRKFVGFLLTAGMVFLAFKPVVAADELAPLVQPPRVPPNDVSDPSSLEGHQIRPLTATVRVGNALSLEIKNCFSYSPEEGSSYIECNAGVVPSNYEQAPLLGSFNASRWSVNGVEGGNANVGRVEADGAKAVYTAPDKVPDPATVAVSAEISTSGQGKRLVNAEITVVERLIHVSVRFSGRREEHGEIVDYSGVADMDYVRADSFEGGVRYDLVINSPDTRVVVDKWNIRSDSIRCVLKSPVTRHNLDAPYSGNFFVYTSLQSYTFGAMIEMVGMVKCKDGESSYEEEVTPSLLLTTSKGPPDLGLQPVSENEKYRGSISLQMSFDEDGGNLTQAMEWFAQKY